MKIHNLRYVFRANNPYFGWKRAIANYSFTEFCKDSIIPTLITLSLVIIGLHSDTDFLQLLGLLLDIGLAVIPAMVALILAAYTLILTVFLGSTFEKVKKEKDGKELIAAINASFAMSLLFSTLTLIAIIVVSLIKEMVIYNLCANIVNILVFSIICYLSLFSLYIIFGIVIDIYNSGQTTLCDISDNQKEDKGSK